LDKCDWLARWREYFLAWYDEGKVDEKAEEAREFSKQYLDSGVVSVSGGKDSMVMLHILSAVKPNLHVFHWDHGPWLMPREIEEEILRNIRLTAPKARLTVEQYRFGWSEKARYDWKPWYRAFFSTLKTLTEELGLKYHLLGVRMEESLRRRSRGRVVEKRFWVEVHPVYYFTWRDIWAYIFKHNVPVPRFYLTYAKTLGWSNVRLTTFHDREFERYGQPTVDGVLMWRFKRQKPHF